MAQNISGCKQAQSDVCNQHVVPSLPAPTIQHVDLRRAAGQVNTSCRCTPGILHTSALNENNKKTFPFGSHPSLRVAPNGLKTSGEGTSVVYSPRDQWPPQASLCCASLERLLCSCLYNKTSLQAHRQKGPTSLETVEQTSPSPPPGWDNHLPREELPSPCSALQSKDKNTHILK